jgi:hypothetical protein
MVKTYAYHKPDDVCAKKIEDLRLFYSNLHTILEGMCPKSRELSVALTNLEQSAMWAIKSLVCNDPNSKVIESVGN